MVECEACGQEIRKNDSWLYEMFLYPPIDHERLNVTKKKRRLTLRRKVTK